MRVGKESQNRRQILVVPFGVDPESGAVVDRGEEFAFPGLFQDFNDCIAQLRAGTGITLSDPRYAIVHVYNTQLVLDQGKDFVITFETMIPDPDLLRETLHERPPKPNDIVQSIETVPTGEDTVSGTSMSESGTTS